MVLGFWSGHVGTLTCDQMSTSTTRNIMELGVWSSKFGKVMINQECLAFGVPSLESSVRAGVIPQEVGQCGSCVKTRHMAIRCPKVRDLPNPCLSHAGQCPVFGDTPMWCLFIPVVRIIVRLMFVHVAKFPRFVAEA